MPAATPACTQLLSVAVRLRREGADRRGGRPNLLADLSLDDTGQVDATFRPRPADESPRDAAVREVGSAADVIAAFNAMTVHRYTALDLAEQGTPSDTRVSPPVDAVSACALRGDGRRSTGPLSDPSWMICPC